MNKSITLRTCAALMYRDIRFMIFQLPNRMIDAAILVLMQVLAIGQFLPLMGMPTSLTAPLFIGTITQIVFSAAYSISFRYISDLNKEKFINYQLTLPVSKTMLFAQIIISFMIEVAFINIPIIFLGSFFLGPLFSLHNAQWIGGIIMYLLSLFFYSLLFIYLAFSSPYTWFLDNVWARRLSPLFLLGCGYFTWKKLYAFNAAIGILVLANPLTYIHEGLRSALLGTQEYLPLWVCMLATSLFCLLCAFLLSRAVIKRLDPV